MVHEMFNVSLLLCDRRLRWLTWPWNIIRINHFFVTSSLPGNLYNRYLCEIYCFYEFLRKMFETKSQKSRKKVYWTKFFITLKLKKCKKITSLQKIRTTFRWVLYFELLLLLASGIQTCHSRSTLSQTYLLHIEVRSPKNICKYCF